MHNAHPSYFRSYISNSKFLAFEILAANLSIEETKKDSQEQYLCNQDENLEMMALLHYGLHDENLE